MKKRTKAGGEKAKTPRRSAPKARRRVAPAASSSPAHAQETEVARLNRELNQALERQTAASEVLRIIGSSPGALMPVFSVILENATRLCQANFGALYLCEGGFYRTVAMHNAPPAFVEARKREPLISMTGTTVLARVAKTKRTIQVADVAEDPAYLDNPQNTQVFVKFTGARSVVWVPMLKNDELVGTIVIFRREVRPFTDKQIELVKNFAAQAVIAIENARLLNELHQRTKDLTESLERQTATSEVLKVISNSPGDLGPVFESLLRNATQLCKARFGTLYLHEEGKVRLVAAHDMPAEFAQVQRNDVSEPAPGGPLERPIATKRAVQITDLAATDGYRQRHPRLVDAVELGGIRTVVSVPMLKHDQAIGVIAIHRREVFPFSDKQVELLQNFAAQAVIAIENARLLNELRQRTTDLSEALDQQTAAAQVLEVISSCPGDLEPVFAAMLASATRICEAQLGNLFLRDAETFRAVAWHGAVAYVENWRREPLIIKTDVPDIPLARLAETKRRVHIADLRQDAAYKAGFAPLVALVDRGGARTLLIVPMLKEQTLVGAIAIYRQEVRPFTDKQIALVENFAAQAVIAIENARLLNELRQRTIDLTESLEQQTATSEVLRVISASAGDLKPVFDAVLMNATQICEAVYGGLFLTEGDNFRAVALHNVPPAFAEQRRREPLIRARHGTIFGRVAATKEPVQIADVHSEPASLSDPRAMIHLAGVRTLLIMPMVKDEELVGAIGIFRQEVRPFTDKQMELLKNFAAQAVIAIENARLLMELRERTAEVEKLNQQLEKRVADQVGEIERMSRLRRFLPPQVADLIVASGAERQLESHRREITALFCDLRGFTGFSESADPEDVMALLRDYHAALGEIIIKYSGTLERYAGDGVMVVFNDPVPVEQPALQAVLMALDMRAAIGALTEKWRRLGHDIGFGIGIAHGFATLGTIGFEGRFDYAAIGTVSNVASRLCDEAKTGQILISPRVLMAVEDAVAVEMVGEFALKGIRRPLAAYNVIAPKALS